MDWIASVEPSAVLQTNLSDSWTDMIGRADRIFGGRDSELGYCRYCTGSSLFSLGPVEDLAYSNLLVGCHSTNKRQYLKQII